MTRAPVILMDPTKKQAAPEKTDADLLRAIAAGDLGPLGTLFDRYHADVRSFLLRSAPRTSDVDDRAVRRLVLGPLVDVDGAGRRERASVEAHPDDPRADEADYMGAIALERAGRRDEAKAAARRYLAKWPAGAHRAGASATAHR